MRSLPVPCYGNSGLNVIEDIDVDFSVDFPPPDPYRGQKDK